MEAMMLTLMALVAALVVGVGYLWYVTSEIRSLVAGAPFVPIPARAVDSLVSLLQLGPDDTFMDLGCGDGRVLDAALRTGARRVVGFDVGWFPLFLAQWRLSRWGSRALLCRQDARMADVSTAEAVYLYLFPDLVDELAAHLAAGLRTGAKVLSPEFPIDTVRHPAFSLLKTKKVGTITAYLYGRV